ncbi:sensor histidine kinase [Kitasatospora sp. NPDC057541]|uniref:sensor histidine kinase n=1 Tax=unclassified Kitasatospora TaxID=2633591 RepID=UPI00367F5D97
MENDERVAPVPWTKRLTPAHRVWTDPLAALVGTAVTAARVLEAARHFDPHGRGNPPPDGPATVAVALLATVVLGMALAARRRDPVGACGLALFAWAGTVVACRQPAIALVVGFWAVLVGTLAVYTAAARERRAARVVLGTAVAGWAVTLAAPAEVGGNVLLAVIGQSAGWAVGDAVRRHRAHTAALAARAVALERAAASEERLRLARELHDVVAHSLGVVSVQAGYGRYALERAGQQDGPAGAALAAIRTVSAEALRETRALLAVLREDAELGEPPSAPAPGLAAADLERLAERTGAAGVAVRVRIRGRERELPPGVGLSGYRIVQEALANVVRHSGAAAARVEVEYRDGELWLEVTDDGPAEGRAEGRARAAAPSGGSGLAGMRERVAPYGGWCLAGPTPSGGFRVTAGLPLDAGQPLAAATGGRP